MNFVLSSWLNRRLIATLWLMIGLHPLVAQISWTTFAGAPSGTGNQDGLAGGINSGAIDGPADVARFSQPDGITVDKNGNVYVSDRAASTIRKITPQGDVTTLAGKAFSPGYVNGTGAEARFDYPRGLCTDDVGNVYVSELNNNAIRKITPQGVVTTQLTISSPTDVVRDSRGNFYTSGLSADVVHRNAIRYYSTSAIDPVQGPYFGTPIALAMGRDDRLFMIDYTGSSIHHIWPNSNGFVLAGSGVTNQHGHVDGLGANARFRLPVGIAVDRDNNVYVADTGNDMIRKITPAGLVSTIGANPTHVGLPEGVGRFADFSDPTSIAIGPDGAIYVANKLNHNIVKGVMNGPEIKVSQWNSETGQHQAIDTPAKISFHPSSVGHPSSISLVIENAGTSALTNLALSFSGPQASEFSASALPLTLAPGDHATVEVKGLGLVAGLSKATLVISSSDVDEAAFSIELSKVVLPAVPSGQYAWARYAGSFTAQGLSDGPRLDALFRGQCSIAFSPSGELVVVQPGYYSVRKIDKEGMVRNVAGAAQQSGQVNGDGLQARFQSVRDVAVSRSGDTYVVDNVKIRKISAEGYVRTLVGFTGSSTGVWIFYDEIRQQLLISHESRDVIYAMNAEGVLTVFAGIENTVGAINDASTTSTFSNPRGMCMDRVGNLYVCDAGNHVIRKISAQGIVTTYAGIVGEVGNIDGARAVATFNSPGDIALASDDSLIVTCAGSHTIRKISLTGEVTTIGGLVNTSGKVEGVGTEARFTTPNSVSVSPDGRICVATANHIVQSTLIGPDLAVIATDVTNMPNVDADLTFYSTYPGSARRSFVCKNVGSAPISKLVSYVSGLQANRFSFDPALSGNALNPGESNVMSLQFQPWSTAASSASLRFGSSKLSPVIKQFSIKGLVVDSLGLWNLENFGTQEPSNTNALTADPDGDGLVNLLEFAFNMPPLHAGRSSDYAEGESGLPVSRIVEQAGIHELRLEYVRRRAASNPGISYLAEFSSNLGNDPNEGWKAAVGEPIVTPIDDTWERVIVRDVLGNGAKARFGRVRIVRNP